MRAGTLPALLAGCGAAGAAVVYLWVIDSEGEGELGSSRVIFVAACLAAAALLAVAGAFVRRGWTRFTLLGLAASILLVFMLVGAMSIGILLVLPTILALRSTLQAGLEFPTSRAWSVALVDLAAVLVVVSGGFASTS